MADDGFPKKLDGVRPGDDAPRKLDGVSPGDGVNRPATARVVVKAPADVKVTVNGQVTSRRSTEEEFQTPELKPGHLYSYVFQAEVVREGKPVTRTQRVMVRAGQRSLVDFNDLRAGNAETATVKVVLPPAGRLYVDGKHIPTTSAHSTFETPRLDSGRVYRYNLEVRFADSQGSEVLAEKVLVEAGKEVTVDFAARVAHRLSRR
jgi:uncharacterized protein (TIGR03000 family)